MKISVGEVDNSFPAHSQFSEVTNPIETILTIFNRKFGVSKYLSASLVVLLIYFALLFTLKLITRVYLGTPFTFNPYNVFYWRDVTAAVVLPVFYIIFIEKMKKIPFEIRHDVDVGETELYQLFTRYFQTIFSKRRTLLSGIILSAAYFIITTFYVISGYYSINFYLGRLVAVWGLFLFGSIIYQAVMVVKIFHHDVKEIPLKISAIFSGLRPVASLAGLGISFWIISVTILSLPTLVLGFNRNSIVWYVSFYGLMTILGLFFIVIFLFGFHKSMQTTKNTMLILLARDLNLNAALFQGQKHVITSDTLHLSRLSWLEQIQIYELVTKGKEWPINWNVIRDLALSYLLPIILSLLGIN